MNFGNGPREAIGKTVTVWTAAALALVPGMALAQEAAADAAAPAGEAAVAEAAAPAAEAAAAARGAAVANPTWVGGDGVTGRLLGALTGGDPVPRLLAVLGGLLLTGSAGTGALWWRSRHTGTAA